MIRRLIILLLIVGCATEPEDCAGVSGGAAGLDSCAVCIGGTTNLTACIQDCHGDWGGTAVVDDCGVCDGITDYVAGSCYDCADTPNGDALVDNCGVCDSDATNDCDKDCADEWGGDAIIDDCGVCDDDTSNDCVQDECGVWGGGGIPNDECDCDGTLLDCAGVCGGSSAMDECNVCDSDSSNDCAVGIYTLTTYFSYNTPDCSGQEEDLVEEMMAEGVSIIITLNTDGIAAVSFLTEITTELITGIWIQNDNNVSIIIDSYTNSDGEEIYDASETFTFIDRQLIIYSYGADGMGHGWISTVIPCEYMVFTNNQ